VYQHTNRNLEEVKW